MYCAAKLTVGCPPLWTTCGLVGTLPHVPKNLDDLEEWATTTPRYAGASCKTCTTYGHLHDLIVRFADFRDSGKSSRGWAEFRDEVLAPKGYGLTESSLRRHVKRCLKRSTS